jgi:4-amino-4-deoxy-L-arabinose transferase
MPDQVIHEQSPLGFFETNKSLVDDNTILVASPPPIGAVCWFFKRHDVYMLMGGGELDYGLSYPDSKHRLLNFNQFSEIVKKNHGVKRIVLVIDENRFLDWKKQLPVPLLVKTTGRDGYTIACF